MRATLPNTDQPRIPHSEYCITFGVIRQERVDLGLARPLSGALLSPRQALWALHCFAFFIFFRFFFVFFFFLFCLFFHIFFQIYFLSSSSELGHPFVFYPLKHGLLRAS